MTRSDHAKALGISRATLYRRIRSGEIDGGPPRLNPSRKCTQCGAGPHYAKDLCRPCYDRDRTSP